MASMVSSSGYTPKSGLCQWVYSTSRWSVCRRRRLSSTSSIWWGDNDDALSVKAIQTAVEQGIQWIDTAPIYGLYHSEEVVGEAMKHIDRDKVVLSTKCPR